MPGTAVHCFVRLPRGQLWLQYIEVQTHGSTWKVHRKYKRNTREVGSACREMQYCMWLHEREYSAPLAAIALNAIENWEVSVL